MIAYILNIATLLLIIGVAWYIIDSDERDLVKRQSKQREPKHK